MPQTAKLRKVRGSVMLAIPPAIIEELDLKPDSQVGLSVIDGKLTIEKRTRPKYTLDELLAKCDPTAEIDAGSREWLDAPPIGRELI